MSAVLISREIQIPTIGTWKWSKSDWDTPLVFQLQGVRASLSLDSGLSAPGQDVQAAWNARLVIEFTNPSAEFVRGLKTSGKLAQRAAEVIHAYYLQVHEQFEGVLRTSGGVTNLMYESPMSIESFFAKEIIGEGGCQSWQLGEKSRPFHPKINRNRRRLIPLFRNDQIITTAKWNKLQLAIDNQEFPAPEMLQLLRIRAQLQGRQKKIPTIEAAILVETLLREYSEKVLLTLGLSKNRVKALRDELTFNTFLNIVLPLSLTRSEATKIEEQIRKVDTLRKIRNDLVHGNIREEDIDEKNVRSGIEGALMVVAFIRRKIDRI
jgi:hypothetical protein